MTIAAERDDVIAPLARATGAMELFDAQATRIDLTALFRAHDNNPGLARPAVIAQLKALIKAARADARAGLEASGDGRACAAHLSAFQDALLALIYDYTTAHIYRSTDPTDRDGMAIVATGGYGRGLLAPSSDIDILFLLSSKQTSRGESIVEYMLLILWDLGFKVGHATRTIEQTLKLSTADMTIRTALLDGRLLFGNHTLLDKLMVRFRGEVVAGAASARAFVEAKLSERDARHSRSGESRYKVEPNIKDGKGGLRDLHTLHWLAFYLHDELPADVAGGGNLFTRAERTTFRRCENFLWTVRCHLHFMTGRAEERLSFDLQRPMAERLGYRGRNGLLSVERFMKHYFLIAKDVGDLTTILCSALEIEQVKSTPSGFATRINPLTWNLRRRVRNRTAFKIDNGRLSVANADVFRNDPVNLIRFFATAEETGTLFHPSAIRLLRASHGLIDDGVRKNAEANRIFLALLMAKSNPEATLRRMNEAGILGRFMPEFGKVVSMMQFNMYHHYTVDEHLVRTIGELARIEAGERVDQLPLSSEIFSTIQNRRALFVAALLHDIGKGRVEDHSVLGARMAREICPRLGLEPEETETVVWLIEKHLVMSTIAQSRDLSDPKTIRTFADIVQSPERLKLLLLLTVADIRAVGPQTWNGWKGQLLRTLYYETEPLVGGGHVHMGAKDRAARAADAFRVAATGVADIDAEAFIQRHYPDYWLRTDLKKQLDHARFVTALTRSGETLATEAATDAFTAITELTVFAPDHPRLLSRFAGACAAAGANIVGAHISTTRDGSAFDTFLLQRDMQFDDDEQRRAGRIGDSIEKILRGKVRVEDLMSQRRNAPTSHASFDVVPEVLIDNALSDRFTVIEVSGLDRAGLLYDLTTAISDLNLDIVSAHITTFGEKAVDVFYVTDLTKKKITAEPRQKSIRDRLKLVLKPPVPREI